MNHHPINPCDAAREAMHAALDDGRFALPPEATAHARTCPACREFWEELCAAEMAAFTLGGAGEAVPEADGAALPAGFHDRVMAAVGGEMRRPAELRRAARATRRGGRWGAWVAAAVALIVLAAIAARRAPDRIDPQERRLRPPMTASRGPAFSLASLRAGAEASLADEPILGAQREMSATARNLLGPALSFGRLIDRDLDPPRSSAPTATPVG
jgi:hypothetical protein